MGRNRKAASVASGELIVKEISAGRWAGERFAAAIKAGKPLSGSLLRTLDTLRKDEWVFYDAALIKAATIRLRAVADLINAGLTTPVANSLGKTILQYEKASDMQPAQTTMSGLAATEDDRVDITLSSLPLPITHKDFSIDLRQLVASRERGEPLDSFQVGLCGRLIAEQIELMTFTGFTHKFLGSSIYGFLTHPDRNQVDFTDNLEWTNASKTGQTILNDVIAMIRALEAKRMFGPYRMYIPSAYDTVLSLDFKANVSQTIRERLLAIGRIQAITTCDQLTQDNVVLYQATEDVVTLVQGEPLQTVQWDIDAGFRMKFKAFTIQVPLIRSDYDGRSGVAHLLQL